MYHIKGKLPHALRYLLRSRVHYSSHSSTSPSVLFLSLCCENDNEILIRAAGRARARRPRQRDNDALRRPLRGANNTESPRPVREQCTEGDSASGLYRSCGRANRSFGKQFCRSLGWAHGCREPFSFVNLINFEMCVRYFFLMQKRSFVKGYIWFMFFSFPCL